jgi:hypothetical protein
MRDTRRAGHHPAGRAAEQPVRAQIAGRAGDEDMGRRRGSRFRRLRRPLRPRLHSRGPADSPFRGRAASCRSRTVFGAGGNAGMPDLDDDVLRAGVGDRQHVDGKGSRRGHDDGLCVHSPSPPLLAGDAGLGHSIGGLFKCQSNLTVGYVNPALRFAALSCVSSRIDSGHDRGDEAAPRARARDRPEAGFGRRAAISDALRARPVRIAMQYSAK